MRNRELLSSRVHEHRAHVHHLFVTCLESAGAVLGILAKVGITRVQRDPADCKSCNLCEQQCFARIDFLSVTEIKSAEYNHCLDCVADCPKPNVLSVGGPRLRFSHQVYASLLVVGLFGMIGVSKATHTWRTKPESLSAKNSAGDSDQGHSQRIRDRVRARCHP